MPSPKGTDLVNDCLVQVLEKVYPIAKLIQLHGSLSFLCYDIKTFNIASSIKLQGTVRLGC